MNKEPITIKVGTRPSRLAGIQVEEIRALMDDAGTRCVFETIVLDTHGDRDQSTPLTAGIADDFFTDTLDRAVLNDEVDVAVHSAKDLPKGLHPELEILALTAGADPTDAFVGPVKFGRLKKGARVGTSSELRQKNLRELNPSLIPVEIRGDIEKRLAQLDEGKYDGVIIATAALKRLGLEDRIRDIMPWEATPLQGQLAVVGRKGNRALKERFAAIDVRRRYGYVRLVGAGPGDPELITRKGVRALNKADCVFYDYLIHKDLLDHAPKAEKIYVGKRKGTHTLSQEELSRMLRDKALAGKSVVRLKGGDPFIFGRGADEIAFLKEYHIPVEVVPGVSSATAIPSSLGVPLTARNISSSVAFLSGYTQNETESGHGYIPIPRVDTLVFLMGLTKLDAIVSSLLHAGWDEDAPIMVVSKGTYVDERVVKGTLGTIQELVKKERIDLPALIVAGEVVEFAQKDLKAKEHILYTGTNPQRYRDLGHIVHLPMIEIRPGNLKKSEVARLAKNLHNYHIILFTSRFAVEHFFHLLKKHGLDVCDLKVMDFIVIGQRTAQALRDEGFEPVLVSDVETSEGLLAAIAAQYNLKGKKILFPRSSLPNPFLEKELTRLGSHVDTVAIYKNVKPAKRALPPTAIDKVLFTSPSTVRNFLKDYEVIPKEWKILSRGPLTSESLKKAGYKDEVLQYE